MKNKEFKYHKKNYSWMVVSDQKSNTSKIRLNASLSIHPKNKKHDGYSIGMKPMNNYTIVQSIRSGLPVSTLISLQKEMAVSAAMLASVIHIASRTLARRKIEGKFRPDESERIFRIAKLYEKAVHVLDGPENARQWLKKPQKGLNGAIPMEYADTEIGAQEVFDLLGRLEHGVFV